MSDHATNGHPGSPERLIDRTLRELRERHPDRFTDHAPASADQAGAAAPARAPRAVGTTPYGRRALDLECATLAGAAAGGRNDQLNKAGFAVYQLVAGGEIDAGEADAALRAAAAACGLAEAEVTKTLRSATTEGSKQPRTAPERNGEQIEAPDIPIAVLNGTHPAAQARPAASPAAPSRPQGQGPEQLRNYRLAGNDQGESVKVGRPLPRIAQDILTRGAGWPKRVGAQLVVPGRKPGDPPRFLEKTTTLFAWLNEAFPGVKDAGPAVDWSRAGGDKPSKDELHEFLLHSACERYATVELFPHWPRLPDALYLHPELPPATGKDLREFVRRFFPATPHDDDLIHAAVLTLFWGGPAGQRPGILITADDTNAGRGAGKSAIAMKLAGLVGGYIGVRTHSQDFTVELLSPNARTKRVALIDNLKSLHFSNMDIEGLVTQTHISGRQLYVGQADRPNYLTWFVTVNQPSVSKDLSERFIPLHIRRPEYGPTWGRDLDAFIAERRWHIAADAVAELAAAPKPLTRYTRHGEWQAAVLSKLPEPDRLVELIMLRQGELDGDTALALEVEEIIAQKLKGRGFDPETEKVYVPTLALVDMVKGMAPSKDGAWMMRWLFHLPLKHLIKSRTKESRGGVWNANLEIRAQSFDAPGLEIHEERGNGR